MKTIIKLILMLFCTTAFSNDLTDKQQKKFLDGIDSVCGDVWCAGDNVFEFNSIICDFKKKNCLVDYKVNNEKGTCEILDIEKFDDLGGRYYPISKYAMCYFHKCFDKYTNTGSSDLVECNDSIYDPIYGI